MQNNQIISRVLCALSLTALTLTLQPADAATISIMSQDFTGNAPVLGTPAPASFTGVFSQSVTGSTAVDRLSPYAFNTNGTTNAAYSILSEDGAGSGSATYNVGASTFTFLWGSPDTYNTVQFWSGANGTGTLLSTTGASGNSYIGSDLACYSTTCGSTLFDLVTFADATGPIGSVVLQDIPGYAGFEYGIGAAVATTPLPATLPLFAGGLGFVGYLTRRRKKVASAAA